MSLTQFAARLAKTQALQRNPGLRQRAANALKAQTGSVTEYRDWKAVKARNVATYKSFVFHGDTNQLTQKDR